MKRLLCRRAARITNWVFYLHFLCACNQKAVVFKFANCFLAGINLFQSPEPTVFFLQHHSVYVIKSKNKLSNVHPTVGLTVNLMALKRCLILNCLCLTLVQVAQHEQLASSSIWPTKN